MLISVSMICCIKLKIPSQPRGYFALSISPRKLQAALQSLSFHLLPLQTPQSVSYTHLADIVDLAYREDSNHRRIHTSQIEADDCFFGFGEKGGEFNKAQKYMVLSPGDSMGYDPKETDSLYKHIPFYRCV